VGKILINGGAGYIGAVLTSCISYIFKKNKKNLRFYTKYIIANAVMDLKKAFENQLLPNSLNDEKYFNIKRMKSVQLN